MKSRLAASECDQVRLGCLRAAYIYAHETKNTAAPVPSRIHRVDSRINICERDTFRERRVIRARRASSQHPRKETSASSAQDRRRLRRPHSRSYDPESKCGFRASSPESDARVRSSAAGQSTNRGDASPLRAILHRTKCEGKPHCVAFIPKGSATRQQTGLTRIRADAPSSDQKPTYRSRT